MLYLNISKKCVRSSKCSEIKFLAQSKRKVINPVFIILLFFYMYSKDIL